MSRGTKACFVFACDPELNEYLKRAVAGGGEEQPASVYLRYRRRLEPLVNPPKLVQPAQRAHVRPCGPPLHQPL
jgi:hypothetical protein